MSYDYMYTMTFDNNTTTIGGREVQMLASTTLVDVTYENGNHEHAVALSGDQLEQLDKIIFRDVITGDIVSIPKALINNGSSTTASTWYTGNVGVLDQVYGSDRYYACETISGANKGILVINDFHTGVDLAISSPSNWDAKIAMNEELINAEAEEYGIDIVAKNTLGTSQGDSVSMRANAYSDDPGICVLMGVADRAQNDYHPGVSVTDNFKRAFLDEEGYENCEGKTYFIFQNPADRNSQFIQELVDHGANVYFFGVGSGGDAHQKSWKYAIDAGVYDALAGDEEAIQQLYDTYTPEVYSQGGWQNATYDDFRTTVIDSVSSSGTFKYNPIGLISMSLLYVHNYTYH